jgi:hypothetical protein
MQGYVNKLVNYKQSCEQFAKQQASWKKRPSSAIPNVERFKDGLPSPPFLVFAVVEALFSSKYADCTWLVNGEADAYCAAAAEEASNILGSSVIFTNDSDLVVFNFKHPVRIAMINELKEAGGVQCNRLEVFEFNPSAVKMQGKAIDLIACAFCMSENQVSLAEAARQVPTLNKSSAGYEEFFKTYDISHWKLRLQELHSMRRERKYIPRLDSRISEPIHQSRDGHQQHLDLFLPVLLEDPTRATAWRVGFRFREAAELLILQVADTAPTLLEYRRSGTRVAATHVSKDSVTQLPEKLEKLAESIMALRTGILTFESSTRDWRSSIMALALQDLRSQGSLGPFAAEVSDILVGKHLSTWPLVHLHAQFEAQYYSIRMLKQVIHWREGLVEPPIVPPLLESYLDGLPRLGEVFGGLNDMDYPSAVEYAHRVVLDVLPRQEKPSDQSEILRPPKRSKTTGQSDRSWADPLKNPFVLLEDDAG